MHENELAWLFGLYNKLSIMSAFDAKFKYPDNPFGNSECTQMSEEEKFLIWVEEFNKGFREKKDSGVVD